MMMIQESCELHAMGHVYRDILGSEDAGKTSLDKILTNYATRQGRRPVLIGLDPKQVPLQCRSLRL